MYKQKLLSLIEKYRDKVYSENEFQSSVESVASSITESHLYHLREFLFKVESELELIKFTTNSDQVRSRFLEKTIEIENLIRDEMF